MTHTYAQSVSGKVAATLIGNSKSFFSDSRFVRAFLLLLVVGSNTAIAETRAVQSINIDQRIGCQTTIEDIRWSHRIWPKENKTPKPSRSEILSDDQIRTKVADNFRMESALAELYGVEITETMLQAELNRPGLLRGLLLMAGESPAGAGG